MSDRKIEMGGVTYSVPEQDTQNLEASEYDNLVVSYQHRVAAAEAALALEKALGDVRLDVFREKVYDIVVEMFDHALEYGPGSEVIPDFVNRIVRAY